MATLLILVLLAGVVLSLLATLIYLYRFLVRKGLFPQLPRLWTVDRNRFFISAGIFLLMSAGFGGAVMFTAPAAPPESAAPENKIGPSFDGQPPAQAAPAAGNERVMAAGQGPAPAGANAGEDLPAGQEESPSLGGEPAESEEQPPAAEAQPGLPGETQAVGRDVSDIPGGAPAMQESPQPTAAPEPTPLPEPTSPPAAKKAPAEKAPALKGWVACAYSFAQKDAAEKMTARLKGHGLEVVVTSAEVKGKTWYRVCLGPAADQAAAKAMAEKAKKAGQIKDYFLVRLK